MPVNPLIPFGSKEQPMFNSDSDASRKAALVNLTASYWRRLRCLGSHRCSDRAHDNHKTIQQQWLAGSLIPFQVAVCHPRIWLLVGQSRSVPGRWMPKFAASASAKCPVQYCGQRCHRRWAPSGSSNQNYQMHMHMQPVG